MSQLNLELAQAKMRAAGIASEAIEVFTHYYAQIEAGATGLLREADLEPLLDVPALADVTIDPGQAREAFGRTVVIKLNGGLGTSMGMDRAKSLLPVRDGRTFLDLIVGQVRQARAAYGVALPLLFMDSFRTREDTAAALAAYPDLPVAGLPLQFLQSKEPKLLLEDLSPATWPADPDLEWCPPGHGDLYPSLLSSGVLGRLLDAGFTYASVSNADNLGATPDPRLAGWFAASGAPYAAELSRRTPADRKGGHLAVRRSDRRLVLRDTAMTAPEEMHHFTDEHRHPFFHTNNLWFHLERLHEVLVARRGVLGLPLIRNVKTVDPTDAASPKVVQIETAMGTAIESFDGAAPILVERARFLPVKTTDDLLVLRSDAYEIGADAVPRLTVEQAPVARLDPRFYRFVDDFDARFPEGIPSLREARGITVEGDWTFGAGVVVHGDGRLADGGIPARVADGTVLGDADTTA